jgi:hypothetical protein
VSADLDVYVLTPQQAKELALVDVRAARRQLDRAKDALQRKRASLHAQIRAAERVGATQAELIAAARCGQSTLGEVLAKRD